MDIERKLDDMGLTLPPAAVPLADYVPFVRTGALIFISGQGPLTADGTAIAGRLGDDLDVEDGARAAQLCALNVLAHLGTALDGDWSRIERCVRLGGLVNATPDFTHHPAVVNGASSLMVALMEERGKHARFAVGVSGLPMNWAVEVEAIFEVR